MNKFKAVLGLSELTIANKPDYAYEVTEAMDGNDYFPSPTPTLDEVNKAARALQDAYIASRDASTKKTSEMYLREFELETLLNALANYVENIANQNQEEAVIIIQSAAMKVKKVSGGKPQTFRVRNSPIDGKVLLTATVAAKSAGYTWQLSTDMVNFSTVKFTTNAKITLEGLEPGTRYYFRVAPVIGVEQGAWEGPISIIVT